MTASLSTRIAQMPLRVFGWSLAVTTGRGQGLSLFVVLFGVSAASAQQPTPTPRKVYEAYSFSTLAGDAGYGSADGTGSAGRFTNPCAAAVDRTGNLYVAEAGNHTIRKITPGGVVTTIAGLAGTAGSVDGAGSAARFASPAGLAVDSADNVYVADSQNHTIRKITSGGVVTTLAGSPGTIGSADGMGAAARFRFPSGVAVDSAGDVYVADLNNTIRKITPDGVVTTFAGLAGTHGSSDGTGNAARFWGPYALAVDSAGNVYVPDSANHTIRKITAAGVVTTLAGLAGSQGSANGTGGAARFNSPRGVAVDSEATVYVADTYNHTIRKITSAGVVTTVAGVAGSAGHTDGVSTVGRFHTPWGLTASSSGNVYVADNQNHTIRRIDSAGAVTTFAGLSGSAGSVDGTRSAARFSNPRSVAADGAGNIYVADQNNHTVRKITSDGTVTTFAGLAGSSGGVNGTGSAARFYQPAGVAVDMGGNVYVAELSCTIRKITPAGVVTRLAGSTCGNIDATGTEARFNQPSGLAVDSAGNVYVADSSNQSIRKITSGGVVTTFAGIPGSSPAGVALDTAGNVYVADVQNHIILKITSGGSVTTLAGLAGSSGFDDGTGSAARFFQPNGVAVDTAGNVYVADTQGSSIRKITPNGGTTTIGGNLSGARGSDDGTGSAARFWNPTGVAVNAAGKVYVADTRNNTIRAGVAAPNPTPTPTPTPTSTPSATASPSPGLSVATNVAPSGIGFTYDYAVTNTTTTPIVAVNVTTGLEVDSITSPQGWVSQRLTTSYIRIVQWVAADRGRAIAPCRSLTGFSLKSIATPGTVEFGALSDDSSVEFEDMLVAGPANRPSQVANISTRLSVGTGDDVLIGGFIVTGTHQKTVIARAMGPSLPVAGVLADPILEVVNARGEIVASSDNWMDGTYNGLIAASGIPPGNSNECAVMADLEPGPYTAVVRGSNDGTGVGLVEIYDVDMRSDSQLANVSTRGLVQTGDNVLIGGFIAVGTTPQKVILRAIGPSLPLANALADPTLELYDGNGSIVGSNDNWQDSNASEIVSTGVPPSHDRDAAIVTVLSPGPYTAVVRGRGGSTGIALVEAYALQ